jgi:amino acid transporter
MMYLLLFASALVLRFKEPNTPRPFKIPGGKTGLAVVCSIGFLSALFAIIIGFFPPEQIPIDNLPAYVTTLLGGVILFSTGPLLIFLFRKRET